MNFETENIEFKAQFTEVIYKEVIAFANTDGGVVFVGIDNNGNAVGLADVDQEYTRITNGIRDAIVPDVTMFVRFSIQDNRVVRIAVSEGSNKPYYLKGKGLKPNGVYVRQGTSSVPASPAQIRQMIKESDGDAFEEMRSMEQNLSFEAAANAFEKYGVPFGKEKYRALGITQKNDELFTNLALIISDQCAHTTKVAVFGDDSNTTFKDNKEFGGSIQKDSPSDAAGFRQCNGGCVVDIHGRVIFHSKGIAAAPGEDGAGAVIPHNNGVAVCGGFRHGDLSTPGDARNGVRLAVFQSNALCLRLAAGIRIGNGKGKAACGVGSVHDFR